MKHYPEELKSNIIARMLPPNNDAVVKLSEETGIPKDTLYSWRIKHRRAGRVASASDKPSSSFSSEERFHMVLETATMTELQTNEYCRTKGLYTEQLVSWRQACAAANGDSPAPIDRDRLRTLRKENRILQAELDRKEKALAETAALLVLKKKVQLLWKDQKDESSAFRSALR